MFATDSCVAHHTNFTLANAGRTIHVGSGLGILPRTPAAPPPSRGDSHGAKLFGKAAVEAISEQKRQDRSVQHRFADIGTQNPGQMNDRQNRRDVY